MILSINSKFMIIDTHAHLMFPEFEGQVPLIIENAKNAGVEKIINIGCDVKTSAKAIALSEKFDCCFATVGLHPYDADDCTPELMFIWEELISKNKKIVAVGEMGLDYVKAKVPKDVQKNAFRMQLALATKFGLQVVVHNRGADEDCLEILREFEDVKAVFHCYGSDVNFARKLWYYGYTVSFTGIITYPNADELSVVVDEVPMKYFFVETDCPYLAPQKYRGKRNEPAYVVEVVEKIAAIKNLPIKDIQRISTENAERFFGI